MRKIQSAIMIRVWFIVFIVLSFTCSATAQKKMEFDYPLDISDTAKKSFEKTFKQGRILYQMSCSKCHDTTVKGKLVIPDFSLPQLMDYEMRMYPEHGEQLTDKYISDKDMEKIVAFLRYKKTTGVKFRGKPAR